MPRTNFFVAFEGLSASGKSTIAGEVARQTGAAMLSTPSSPFRESRDRVDKHATPEARYFFYLAGVFQADQEIRNLLQSTSVVCDRFLLTTECWHRTIGVETLGGYQDFRTTLLTPDITFLVVCPEDERRRRLHARGLTWNDEQEERGDASARFLAEYRRHSMVEIDSCGSFESSVEQVLNLLREHSLWRG